MKKARCHSYRNHGKGNDMMRRNRALWRLFEGRNGADQLYQCMMWCCLALAIVNLFFSNVWIYGVEIVLLGLATYRLLSRNISKRQRENQAFLNFFSKIGKGFRRLGNRWRDRKTHVYKKCPQCKNYLRLPKIKGKHTVCCPCCTHRFGVNI